MMLLHLDEISMHIFAYNRVVNRNSIIVVRHI